MCWQVRLMKSLIVWSFIIIGIVVVLSSSMEGLKSREFKISTGVKFSISEGLNLDIKNVLDSALR